MEKLNSVRKTIDLGKLPREVNHFPGVNGVNALGAGSACQQSKNARTTAEVHDDVAWTHSFLDSFAIGGESQIVGSHIAKFVERVHSTGRPRRPCAPCSPARSWHLKRATRKAHRCAKDRYVAQFAAPEYVIPSERATRILRRAACDRESNSCRYSVEVRAALLDCSHLRSAA